MHGGSGRVDGGIGITLDEPGMLLEAELSPVLSVSGGDPVLQERVRGIATDVLQKLGAGGSVAITIRSSLSRPMWGSGAARSSGLPLPGQSPNSTAVTCR